MPPRGSHLTTRGRLARYLSARCVGLNIDMAGIMVTALFDGMSEALVAGDVIEIRRFGTWRVFTMPAGKYWDIYRGKHIKRGPRKYIKFQPSADLRARVKKS